MAYNGIVLIVSLGLSIMFVFYSDASFWLRALVAGLFAFSFLWQYGIFIQAALGVSISIYLTYLKASS